jgi:hypothetical protein
MLIHEGRPYWLSEQFGRVPTGLLGSFHFLDNGADPESMLPFRISPLPTGWRQLADAPPNTVLFRARPGTASVTVGTPQGRITTCADSTGQWEACRDVSVATIDALVDAVEPRRVNEDGVGLPVRASYGTIDLDGTAAKRVSIEAYEEPARGAEHVTYIVTFHEGRPVVMRFHSTWTTPPPGWIAEFLDGFRWTPQTAN